MSGMDLEEFLTARLDEDERVARAAAKAADRDWLAWTESSGRGERAFVSGDGDPVAECGGYPPSAAAAHIARHDPARVVADVAARRRIVELHAGEEMDTRDGDGEEWSDTLCGLCLALYPCDTLRLLGLPDADHSDYRGEWRP